MRDIIQGLTYKKPSDGFDPNEFAKLLEEQYLSQRKNKHRKKESFAPSGIGYGHNTCAKYWFHAFNGCEFEDSHDALSIAAMESGSAAHERIEKLIESAGILVDKEVEITMSDPPIRGFIDVLIRWDDEIVVGEIKTAKQEIFNHRKLHMKPSPNHLFQILIYLKATGKKQGFLLYEDKNTNQFLVLKIDFNEENQKIVDGALDWMREVYRAYQDNTMPTRPFTKKSAACKSCPVFNVCWEGEDGTLAVPKMPVPK